MFLIYIERQTDGRDGEAETAECQSSRDRHTNPNVESADEQDDHDANHRLNSIHDGRDHMKGPLTLLSDSPDQQAIASTAYKLEQEGDEEDGGYRPSHQPVVVRVPAMEQHVRLVAVVQKGPVWNPCLFWWLGRSGHVSQSLVRWTGDVVGYEHCGWWTECELFASEACPFKYKG